MRDLSKRPFWLILILAPVLNEAFGIILLFRPRPISSFTRGGVVSANVSVRRKPPTPSTACDVAPFPEHDSEQRHAAHSNHRPRGRLGDGRHGESAGAAQPRD